MFVGKNFLPQDDQSQYNVLVRTPEGTSLAATTGIAERIAQEIRKMPGVAHTLADRGRQRGQVGQQCGDLREAHGSSTSANCRSSS